MRLRASAAFPLERSWKLHRWWSRSVLPQTSQERHARPEIEHSQPTPAVIEWHENTEDEHTGLRAQASRPDTHTVARLLR